ncbi:MAG: hypothetical protein JW881_16630 [Spirochaetales bacterium]|nr:hypothetical protein [Spirochaetales bacterium]
MMNIIDRDGSTLEDMQKKQPDKRLLKNLEENEKEKKGIGALLKKIFSRDSLKK